MKGAFDITCHRRPDGATAIGHQAVSAPWHLSKPYWDGKVLIVQTVNATAGIFAGDDLDFHVTVETGASVLLTSPSASRIHTMPRGEASLRQAIRVESGAWLEWMPELFIPQAGCRYRQNNEIHVADGGGLYMVETLAPGRVAHGETFAFDRIYWNTRLWHDGRLILAERYPMAPSSDQSLRDLTGELHLPYFASALLVHPERVPFREWQEVLHDINSSDLRIGATSLTEGVYLFRIVARTSAHLKETLVQVRATLAGTLPLLRQSARKL
jgi:urease accessory protein